MAQDVRRRQKRLARQKAKKKQKRTALTRQRQPGLLGVKGRLADAPIVHACAIDELWRTGIGNVLLSRELPDGRVAYSMFLVDIYCLGVKDAFCDVLSHGEYEFGFFASLAEKFALTNLTAESLRKLVEGAVDYAAQFELPPHSDYRMAKLIFNGIDADASDETFEYGFDGEPFFVSGPNDTPERCDRIIALLAEHCGDDGFDYVIRSTRMDGGFLDG